jgi:alkane 1-monooxygenase
MTATVTARAAGREAAWRDGKRYLWTLGLMVPVLPFVGAALWRQHHVAVFWWFTPIMAFVLLPLVDPFTGRDGSNVPEPAAAALAADHYYRYVTYLYLPLQYGALVLGGWAWTHWPLGLAGQAGLATSLGTVSGIGINAAHEMGHKREATERWLSKLTLAATGYGHFYTEHNRGHHTRVATPEDPASARLGESFWAFWPRTVAGSARSAWHLEATRLRRRGRRVLSLRNHNLNAWLMTVVLFGALAAALGPGVLILLAVQAVVGFSLLEAVNYLEHYGLARQRTASGRYEKVEPRHSWNAVALASNLALFHLQRHSDHHAYPTRRYQVLRSFDSAPQLPAGYATLVVAALIPPLWRRWMDPLVLAHYGGDVTLANLHPPRRARLLARYGQGEPRP